MSTTLGSLERVDPRLAWPEEAENFTPWLASPEGLKLLGDTLGIGLELEAEEHAIGPFKADILARRTDTPDEQWVVNQLEKTDHGHLGQMLTYAAGVKANTVIWVATQFVDQHRAAIDWLNTMTAEGLQFFGLEIELWRIGPSPLAPKLNVVARPNDWSRAVNEAKKTEGALTPQDTQRVRFWEGLRDLLIERKSPVKAQKPSHRRWAVFAIGIQRAWLQATMGTNTKALTAECQMRRSLAKGLFDYLHGQKTVIEAEVGPGLIWENLPDRDLQRIYWRREGTDPTIEAQWAEQHLWISTRLEALHKALAPRVKAFAPADDPPV